MRVASCPLARPVKTFSLSASVLATSTSSLRDDGALGGDVAADVGAFGDDALARDRCEWADAAVAADARVAPDEGEGLENRFGPDGDARFDVGVDPADDGDA